MQSNKAKLGVIVALVLIIVGVGAVVYALTRDSSEQEDQAAETAQQPAEQSREDYVDPGPTLPLIVFTDDGFTAKEYRYKAGTAIRVDNRSSMDMQFSSDDHPSHRENTELNMKLLGAGESGTFTPPGKGTYGFHDHINDQYTGTLIIE